MNRNFDQLFKNFNGTDVRDGDAAADGVEAALTLKAAAVNSLMAVFPGDEKLAGDEKLKRYLLATRIYPGGLLELSAEEVTQLKILIGRSYPPLIVGQAFQMLEKDET